MIEYFDFEDGNGEVPAHKHPNGGGWVANTAYVSPTAYVGPNVRVYHNARVYAYSRVYHNPRITGFARVFGDAVVSGIRRSDSFTFIYVPDDEGVMKVQAGCRDFTMREARKHWKKTRSGTPLGDETMEILKALQRLSKFKPEGCV